MVQSEVTCAVWCGTVRRVDSTVDWYYGGMYVGFTLDKRSIQYAGDGGTAGCAWYLGQKLRPFHLDWRINEFC